MARLEINIVGKIQPSLIKDLRSINTLLETLSKNSKSTATSFNSLSNTMSKNRQQTTAAAGSYREAQRRLVAMGKAIREAENGFNSNDPAVRKNIAAYRALNEQLRQFDKSMGLNYRNVGNYGSSLKNVGNQLTSFAASYVSVIAAAQAFNQIISNNAKISDSIADIQRTAEMSQKEARELFNELKRLGTRTGLEELAEISVIAGQLGIAKKEIAGFTEAVDALAVVLKNEIPGGAEAVTSALGKINGVFRVVEDGGLTAGEAMNKTGSAILALGQAGLATGDFIVNFTQRVAGASSVVGIALPTMLAYGAVLEEAGVSAEVAGTATSKLLGQLAQKRNEFYSIAQIADATLTLDQFVELINTDADAALRKFFKGLDAGGQTTTQFYDILKTAGINTERYRNAVLLLAQDQEKLAKLTQLSTEEFTKGTLAAEQFAIRNDTLGASIDLLKKSFVSLTTSGNVSDFLKGLTDGFTDIITLVDRLVNSGSLKELEARFKALFAAGGGAAGLSFSKSLGDVVAAAKKAEEESKRLASAPISVRLANLDTKEQETAIRNLKEIVRIREEAYKKDPTSKNLQELEYQRGVLILLERQYKKTYSTAKKEADSVFDVIEKIKEASREELDAIKIDYSRFSEDSNFSKAIKARESELKKLENAFDSARSRAENYAESIQKVFSEGTHKSNIINSANPELQKVRNEYQKLFDDIDRIEKKALADKKITEAQKTEAVQSASEKRKQIAQAQAIAENDILYKQGTASLEKSLQEQYSLWQKYEDWRKNVSIESANERYKNELDAIKGFETRLHSEVAGLLSKALTPIGINESESKRLEMLSGLLKSYYTQQENENDKYLQNLLTTYEGYESKRKNLAKDYVKDMANISGEEAAVRTKAYEEALRRLWDSQIAGSDVFRELDIQLDFGSLASAKKALKSAKEFIDDLFKNLNPTNAQEAKAAAELKKGIDKALSGIDRGLSEKTYDVVVDLAGEFETLVSSATEFDGTMKTALRSISSMVGAVGSVAKSLGGVMGESGKGLMSAGGWAAAVGAAISVVGGIFEAIDRKREQREKEREERLKYAEDYRIKQLNLQTSILQKQASLINEMYGTQKIEAYANVIAGINKEQERLLKIQRPASSRALPDEFINSGRSKILQNTGIKEVDEWIVRYNKALTSTNASERQWAGQILPQIQREATKAGVALKELAFDLTNLSDMDAVTIQSMIDTGSFDEATSKFLQTVLDLMEQEAEAIKLLKQELTGTTFESIADGLVDIFTRGDNALEDFEKNFDELMRKSLIQSLKRSIMSDALKRWYDDFAAFSQDGLDEAEIASLRNSYNAIGEQIKTNAENLEKATGISLSSDTGSDGSTMQGRISRAITEATGSQILGFERAKFDIDRNQLALLTAVFMPGGTNILQTTNNILSDSLDALNLIEENTFNTVEELKKSVAQLTAINKNTVTRLSRD